MLITKSRKKTLEGRKMKETAIFAVCVTASLVGIIYGAKRRMPARVYEPRRTVTHRLQALESQVAELFARVKALEQKPGPGKIDGIADHFEAPLEVGQIAYFGSRNYAMLEQIIDANNMLVDIITDYEPVPDSSARSTPVTESRFLTYAGTRYRRQKPVHELIWVKGIPTGTLADGSRIPYRKPLKITGTKTYEVVFGGSKTVFVFEPHSTD
jgi:hypothetical protein